MKQSPDSIDFEEIVKLELNTKPIQDTLEFYIEHLRKLTFEIHKIIGKFIDDAINS